MATLDHATGRVIDAEPLAEVKPAGTRIAPQDIMLDEVQITAKRPKNIHPMLFLAGLAVLAWIVNEADEG